MDLLDSTLPRFAVFDDPQLTGIADLQFETTPVAPRGVAWVLRWAGAVATLLFSLITLIEFACVLSAEQTVARAARAGALEATLPRATAESIADTVERRLGRLAAPGSDWTLDLKQNDMPTRMISGPREGDHFSVTVSLSNRAALPDWLRRMSLWRGDSRIEAQAERRMPGRGVL